MKFKTTAGKEIVIDIKPSKYKVRDIEDCKSKIQYEVGLAIQEMFPNEMVLEEFSVPKERLFLDFFIPLLRIVVEVDGAQHGEYVRFFHGDKLGFKRAQARDRRKEEWCKINNILLIRLKKGDNFGDRIRSEIYRSSSE